MKSRTLIVLAYAALVLGMEDYLVQPQPAGAESEASSEAPMVIGRRRGRRRGYMGGGRMQQDPQQKYQQQQAAKNLRNDQMDANRHARELQHLHKKDIIHNYNPSRSTTP